MNGDRNRQKRKKDPPSLVKTREGEEKSDINSAVSEYLLGIRGGSESFRYELASQARGEGYNPKESRLVDRSGPSLGESVSSKGSLSGGVVGHVGRSSTEELRQVPCGQWG